jgi:anti-sigma regulatory factor (Ser/Thr protein kinase)
LTVVAFNTCVPTEPLPDEGPVDTGSSLTVLLPVDPRYISKARRLLRVFAAGSWIPLDELALLVSEVVTNAFEHGGLGPDDQLRIEAELNDHSILVRVHDRGPGIPEKYRRGAPDLRGSGLRVVDHVASAWGSGPGLVWFQL